MPEHFLFKTTDKTTTRQRQDNARQRQDNDNFSKNPVFMRFLEVTRQQDNEIAFQTIYLYITTIYTLFFSILLPMRILFLFF